MRICVSSFTVLACVVASLSASAGAQPSAARLTLADAIAAAVAAHPEIAAAGHRVEAAGQRPTQERSFADPMLSAGYTSIGKPLPGSGLGTEPNANISVMVSQELPFPGKRNARAAVAVREVDAEKQLVETARLSVVSRVKQAYYGLAATRAARRVLERNRELLSTLLKVSEERYAVGRAAQQDVIKAQTQVSLLELQILRAAQTERTREGELNALLGRPAGSVIGEIEDLALTPFAAELEGLIASAASAPLLRRDEIMIDRSRLAVDLARVESKPDFNVSGEYAFAGDMPAMYEFRVGMSIPLQRKRRAAAIAEQQGLAAAAQRTYDATRLAVQEQIQRDFEMATTASRLAVLYRDTVLPQARLALESSLASYQTGAVDFLSVLTNFSMVLEYELTWFEQLAELHQAISRLEEMTGTTLSH